MSLDMLKQDLKNKKIGKLYLLYGPEEYLKKYYLSRIEKIILSEETKSLNKAIIEGKVDSKSAKNIIDNCETFPVFADRKLVLVKDSGLFKAKKKEEGPKTKKKGLSDELTEYLQNISPNTCLLFYENEIDKRLKIVDVVKKNGLVVEFANQKPVELVKWVIKVFKAQNKIIDIVNASKIVDNCEQGMNEILNEINKIVLFMGEAREVTGEIIEKVCVKSVKGRIFDLTDAIAEKNKTRALKLLDDMITLREPLPKILFMIARQFRQILEMKLLRDEGKSIDDAAVKIGVSPYAGKQIHKQTSRFTLEILKEAIRESLEMDVAIKTGKINDRIAVELLITKFSI
jgi:DNA polymerase III subunit delta